MKDATPSFLPPWPEDVLLHKDSVCSKFEVNTITLSKNSNLFDNSEAYFWYLLCPINNSVFYHHFYHSFKLCFLSGFNSEP